MPVVIENGGGGDVTSSELGGIANPYTDYLDKTQTFADPTTGNLTPQESQLISHVEQKLDVIAQGWIDSGGPGGHQQAVSREILRRAALLQGDLLLSVRQWARPGRERALIEMFGVLTKALVDRDRLLLELRERLNASPY